MKAAIKVSPVVAANACKELLLVNVFFAACSEEIDGGLSNRQGLLDDSETWAQGVGGRRMVQRYVGMSPATPEFMYVLAGPGEVDL